MLGALHDIARTYSGQRILIITHGWVMDVITRHVRNLPRTVVLEGKRKNGEALWLGIDGAARFIEYAADDTSS